MFESNDIALGFSRILSYYRVFWEEFWEINFEAVSVEKRAD